MPQRFTSTQIEHLVNKCTLHSIDKLFGSDDDTRGVRVSRKDNIHHIICGRIQMGVQFRTHQYMLIGIQHCSVS